MMRSPQAGSVKSTLSILAAEGRQLKDEVSGLRRRRAVSSDSDEINSTFQDHGDKIHLDTVPV